MEREVINKFAPTKYEGVIDIVPIDGAVLSSFTVTFCEFVPPALVAEHVTNCPVVSVVTFVVPHPVLEEIVDSESVTVQVTETSELLKPYALGVGLT